MTRDRLSSLHLLPPATGIWQRTQVQDVSRPISRVDGEPVPIPLPLFWYSPPWIELPTAMADRLAAGVASHDIVVSALHRDVCDEEQTSEFFSPLSDDPTDQVRPSQSKYPRMTPYRAERFGFSPIDFDDTLVIDVRLAASRDPSGRLAYSPDQMSRWERPAEGVSIGGGGYVAAGTFPTDVASLKQMRVKLDQLRELAPSAASFITIGPFRLEAEISAAIVAQPDGLILRLDQTSLEGIELAALVRKAKRVMKEKGCEKTALWVVPGPVSPTDIVKLMALGADAVAIDDWCNPLIQAVADATPISKYERSELDDMPQFVAQHLWEDLDLVSGWLSTITPAAPPEELLGTFQDRWAKACGVPTLKP